MILTVFFAANTSEYCGNTVTVFDMDTSSNRISSLIPLLIQQQMGCWGKERQRKLHAESTPSFCETANTISVLLSDAEL